MEKYNANRQTVRICGKTDSSGQGLELVHSWAFAEFDGEMGKLELELCGESEEEDFAAYVAIFTDDDPEPSKVIKVKNGIHTYKILDDAKKKTRTVKVAKITEKQFGRVWIRQIRTDGKLVPAREREKRLLFIGDSITAGYGVVKREKDEFTTATENVTMTYPYIVAEHMQADAWFVCWSGGGIISGAIEPESEEPDTIHLLPAMLEDGLDSEYIPDLISVNLGTNDAGYIRGKEERKAYFQKKYEEFVEKIAEKYPKTPILIAYGEMDISLIPTIENVVEDCKQKGIACYFVELPQIKEEDGIGVVGHPTVVTNRKAADVAERKIMEILKREYSINALDGGKR